MQKPLFALMLTVPAPVFAADELFVGVTFGQPELTASSGGTSVSSDADSDLILSAGRRWDEARAYGSVHAVDTGASCCKFNALTFSYDRFLGEGQARGLLGGTLGWANYRESGDIAGYGHYSYDHSGLAYGIQLGAIIGVDASNRTEFEIAYHYLRTTVSGDIFGVTIDLEKVTWLEFGLNVHL